MKIQHLINSSYRTAREKGFWEDTNNPSPATYNLSQLSGDILDLTRKIEMLRKTTTFVDPNTERLKDTYDKEKVVLCSKLVLLVSEIGEALEAISGSPNDNYANLGEELADIGIRWGDLCGFVEEILEMSVEEEIIIKKVKNDKRPYKHGKKA